MVRNAHLHGTPGTPGTEVGRHWALLSGIVLVSKVLDKDAAVSVARRSGLWRQDLGQAGLFLVFLVFLGLCHIGRLAGMAFAHPIHQCLGAGSFEIGTTMRALYWVPRRPWWKPSAKEGPLENGLNKRAAEATWEGSATWMSGHRKDPPRTTRNLLLALGQGAAVRIGIIGFVIAHGAELMALMAGRLWGEIVTIQVAVNCWREPRCRRR
jgi:hypothetical protein